MTASVSDARAAPGGCAAACSVSLVARKRAPELDEVVIEEVLVAQDDPDTSDPPDDTDMLSSANSPRLLRSRFSSSQATACLSPSLFRSSAKKYESATLYCVALRGRVGWAEKGSRRLVVDAVEA
jgi:hypothetical protein